MRSDFVSALEKLLEGSSTLSDLQKWLLSRLQLILDSGDETAIEAANAIDAAIVDLDEGLIAEKEFISKIEASIRLMQTFKLEIRAAAFSESTSTPHTLNLGVALR